MENHVEVFNGGSGVFSLTDIFYPCNGVPEQYRYRCYMYQSYYILRANNYEYAQSLMTANNSRLAQNTSLASA
ncbi:MAG: hypothetical protein IH978_06845 [Nitrospinae bacterium]|nr:hypothetical protein [Nitrospinota bacterium]